MLKNIKLTAKFSPNDKIYQPDINKERYYQWEFSNKKSFGVYQKIDEESYGMFGDPVKQMSMSKSLQTKNKSCAVLKEAVSKNEVPEDSDNLDVVIGSKESCYSVNYVNYFSRFVKHLNEYSSFNFYYNFIKINK